MMTLNEITFSQKYILLIDIINDSLENIRRHFVIKFSLHLSKGQYELFNLKWLC